MGNTPFIAVEGPIGVGKTTLAKAIADHYQYPLLKEIVEENPFLGKFYEDISEWSFQTEMFFLCNRYKQLGDTNKNYLTKNSPVVSDYHILKNLIFAERSLNPIEYEKYLKIFDILTVDMPKPNMIIYLHASLDTLVERIKLRGRDIEKNISTDYLQQLAKDYEVAMDRFEKEHPEVTVLRFNGDELDFVKNKEDLDFVLSSIQNAMNKGN